MHQPGRLSRVAWTVVGLLWVVATLNYLDRQLVVTMPGPIKADLGIGNERFGLLSSVFLWVYGICSPIAGYVADRVGKRPVIIASLLIWSAATFITGVVHSFEGMLVARATLGVSEAFYMPAAVALIVEYHRGSTRSRATGLHVPAGNEPAQRRRLLACEKLATGILPFRTRHQPGVGRCLRADGLQRRSLRRHADRQ